MSPMPRMRPATRSGWKSSSASSFSPTPASLIGAPVTARIDSAAPPRASPSMRVSTMPVTPTRLVERLARCSPRPGRSSHRPPAASRPGWSRRGLPRTSSISAWSIDRRPAVSRMTTSNTSRRAGVHGAAGDLRPASGRRRSAGWRRPARSASCCSCSCAAGRWVSRLASSTRLRRSRASGAARACRRWWSCPSPAGRPSGWGSARRRSG